VAPRPADRFPLTAAQLVLARRHGFASWARTRRYVQIVADRAWSPGQPAPGDEPLADRFLRLACLTYSDDQSADLVGAAGLLASHPGLLADNLFVAAACADVAQVRRHLAGGAAAAGAGVTGAGAWAGVAGGPHGWYLCHGCGHRGLAPAPGLALGLASRPGATRRLARADPHSRPVPHTPHHGRRDPGPDPRAGPHRCGNGAVGTRRKITC